MGAFKISVMILKNKTELNKLILYAYTAFVFGSLFDCQRVLLLNFFGFIYQPIDLYGFLFKTILIFVGISILVRIFYELFKSSGDITKGNIKIRIIYLCLTAIFSIATGFTYVITNTNDQGFYMYQVNFILFVIIQICYSPFLMYVLVKSSYVLKKITDEKVASQSKYFIFTLVILVAERFSSLEIYYIFNNSDYVLLFNLSLMLITAVIFNYLIFFKYPDLLDSIFLFFSLKSLYLVYRNGIIIYQYNFQKRLPMDIEYSKDFVLGGLLSIIGEGIGPVLSIDQEIRIIDFGDIKIMFKFGKMLFGILLMTENVSNAIERFHKFIEKFEIEYEQELIDWDGDTSYFDKNKIENWINKIIK